MPPTQITTVLSPTKFCSFCDHPAAWHDDLRAGSTEVGCTGLIASKCNCLKFCDGYIASETDGLRCYACGQSYFEHGPTKRMIKARLLKSDRLDSACASDIAYRVFPAHLKDCCHWTIYHFMKRVDEKDLKPRMSIKCVECTPQAILTIVQVDEGVADWAWKFTEVLSLPPATSTDLTLPPATEVEGVGAI